MSSGFGRMMGAGGSTSPFFRFFALDLLDLPIELELGSSGGRGSEGCSTFTGGNERAGGSGVGGSGLTSSRMGEWEGCDEGGEMEVMSTEGDLARFAEDWELGEGVSSGAGGGGRTKWNVRDAI